MDTLLVLPILIPLVTAALAILAWRQRRAQQALAIVGALGLLAAAVSLVVVVAGEGIQATSIGSWPAPYGISLVADLFSATMVLVAAVVGLGVAVYSVGSLDPAREAFGYYALVHILLMGVCGAFLTGDVFNLYVWFEVMLIASFMLVALGAERPQLQAALKYVVLNLIASAMLLTGVGLLYGAAGTLNMAHLARVIPEALSDALATSISILFLTAFGIKAAVFPLFFWLPATYHTPPVAVSALFAGLLTKVGVYALLRVFTLLFPDVARSASGLFLVIAGCTMVAGVFGAMVQKGFRRLLSFHIISQVGYMVIGLGLLTRAGVAAAIYYIVHHILVKTNLFFVSGVANAELGTFTLSGLGGLYRARPGLAILFLIPALSLAGIPPLSGFVGKLGLVVAGVESREYAIVAVTLGVGLLTLFSMSKVWAQVFWEPPPGGAQPSGAYSRALLLGPVVVFAAATVALGLLAEPAFSLALRAADQLLAPNDYIEAVLP